MLPLNKDGSLYQNASTLARLSQIAYFTLPNLKEWLPAYVDDFELFSTGNGFACRIEHNFIYVFRGTAAFADVQVDVKAWMTPIATGYAHEGFARLVRQEMNIYAATMHKLSQRSPAVAGDDYNSKLWLTGHSLGGAVATMVGHILHNVQPDLEIHTFGSPKVYDGMAAAAFDRAKIDYHRFVNTRDPVPTIPIEAMCGNYPCPFVHCGKQETLPTSWLPYLRDKCLNIRRGFRKLWHELRDALMMDLDQHDISLYIKHLGKALESHP